MSQVIRLLVAGLVAVGASACGTPPKSEEAPDERTPSQVDSAAIRVATKRLAEHGHEGFSLEVARRTRDWFTPELFALLVRDMSDTNGIGYLNWDPFTGAQDEVGPFRFESITRVGDTIRVRFSRERLDHRRGSVTLAMRLLDGQWRIANFLYPDNEACNRDLAAGLARYAQPSGANRGDADCP